MVPDTIGERDRHERVAADIVGEEVRRLSGAQVMVAAACYGGRDGS